MKNSNPEEIFGKAIGQLIHDIRNPLNTIIGFSSILKIDENLNDEIKGYIKKIFHSGMIIEKLLSNIDYYMIDEISSDSIDFDILSVSQNYFNTLNDIFEEKQLNIEFISEEKIIVNSSIEIFNKILDNLFHYSLKGLRASKKREISVFFKKENNDVIMIYSDSSTPIFIENDYFSFDEILKSKRGLGILFIEKYIRYYNGNIKYFYGNKWQTCISLYTQKIKNNHGFLIKLPIIK